jgi:EAL domain-containing protein (putative c-di-GMP-specific phosphodiesterase class I)
MGHLLGLDVVAEGIETEEHLSIVADKGVNIAQGYFISRPLVAGDFESFLTSYQ